MLAKLTPAAESSHDRIHGIHLHVKPAPAAEGSHLLTDSLHELAAAGSCFPSDAKDDGLPSAGACALGERPATPLTVDPESPRAESGLHMDLTTETCTHTLHSDAQAADEVASELDYAPIGARAQYLKLPDIPPFPFRAAAEHELLGPTFAEAYKESSACNATQTQDADNHSDPHLQIDSLLKDLWNELTDTLKLNVEDIADDATDAAILALERKAAAKGSPPTACSKEQATDLAAEGSCSQVSSANSHADPDAAAAASSFFQTKPAASSSPSTSSTAGIR